MSEYKIVNNYLVFKELSSDSLGANFRAGEIADNKAVKHQLLTDVYPFIANDPDAWKRVNILMEGIKKSNIPNLYSPEKIVRTDDKALLLFPLMKARTFEQLLEDSNQKDIPINFDLTFSIAVAIADLLDTGSSIVVSGKKSFHGFLTPDNILIDNDGKIYLKNYGIYPYLGKNETMYNEMVNKYGAWIAPEFLRKEKLTPQSDIYHLGYILYRILTGEYFSYPAGEDFETKLSNISFTQHLPSDEKDFITNIITFFKKTLNPDPSKRFANIKEFKDYIAHYFHIEELSSVTFNLAYFMNSLYLESGEQEQKILEEELAYTIPVVEEEPAPVAQEDSHLAEDILAGLEEKKGSKMKVILPVLAVIIIAVIAIVFYMDAQKKAAQEQQAQIKRDMEARFAQLRKQQEEQDAEKQRIQDQMKAMMEKTTTTESEKKEQEDVINKLRERQKALELKEQERLKQLADAEQKKKELAAQQLKDADEAEKKRIAEEEQKKKEAEKKRLEEERNRVTPGQLLPLIDVNVKPEKIKGKDPIFPAHIRRRYAGNKNIDIRANILIDETGAVANVRILSQTPDDLKSIIVKSLKKWKYNPAKKNDVAVKVWKPVSIKVSF